MLSVVKGRKKEIAESEEMTEEFRRLYSSSLEFTIEGFNQWFFRSSITLGQKIVYVSRETLAA